LINNSVDFDVHWNKVNDPTYKPNYPNTYHLLFGLLSFDQFIFYFANLLIICALIPYLIFKVTKTWWGAFLYFAGVSLPHMWIYGATFPQSIVFLLFLMYLIKRKNVVVLLITGFLASLIHREGIYLFILVVIAELIDYMIVPHLRKYAPFVVLGVQKFNTIPDFLFYLLANISIPLWIAAKNIFIQPFYLILAIAPLFMLNYDARIVSVTQLVILLISAPVIAKYKHKKAVLLILFAYLFFFLYGFSAEGINLFLK
jgi:hypothetical protein